MSKTSPRTFWWEVIVTLPGLNLEIKELISEALFQAGASAVEEVFYRRKVRFLKTHFPAPTSLPRLKKRLSELFSEMALFLPGEKPLTYKIKKFTKIAWKDAWKKHLKVVSIFDKVFILPLFQKKLPKDIPPQAVIVRLNPGLAFGTGQHPTTHLCLEMLVKFVDKLEGARTRQKISFLDVGTGSGILALVAGLLGISDVTALDNDPTVIETAMENISRHHLKVFSKAHKNRSGIHLFAGVLENLDGSSKKWDLIVANILLRPLLDNMYLLKKLLKPQGQVILSGVLASEEKLLAGGLKAHGLTICESKKRNGWLAIRASRSSQASR